MRACICGGRIGNVAGVLSRVGAAIFMRDSRVLRCRRDRVALPHEHGGCDHAEGARRGEQGVIAAFEKSPSQLLGNKKLYALVEAGQVGVIDR